MRNNCMSLLSQVLAGNTSLHDPLHEQNITEFVSKVSIWKEADGVVVVSIAPQVVASIAAVHAVRHVRVLAFGCLHTTSISMPFLSDGAYSVLEPLEYALSDPVQCIARIRCIICPRGNVTYVYRKLSIPFDLVPVLDFFTGDSRRDGGASFLVNRRTAAASRCLPWLGVLRREEPWTARASIAIPG